MSLPEPILGSIVAVAIGKGVTAQGVTRFIGPTSFSTGKWVGVELYEPKGKNDGSVQGVMYFHCKPLYGVFVRLGQAKVLAEPHRPPSVTSSRPGVLRPGPTHQRRSSLSTGRAPSVRSGPSSSRSASPAKPSVSTPQTAASPPRTKVAQHPPPKSPAKRLSLSTNGRPAHGRQPSLSARPPQTPLTARPPATPVLPTYQEPPPRDQTPSPAMMAQSPSELLDESLLPPETDAGLAEEEQHRQEILAHQQAEQELRAKIRVLEAKRGDDARHIRELETRLSEAESFVALRPKLQAKLTSLQTDLIATKRALADSEQLASLSEGRLFDSQEQLEMAMLDKEVAEERAEAAEAELEDVRERLAVAEVELEVGKSTETSPEEDTAIRSSLAYLQLEKQNERLKEALIRLRDMSQETDQEQRRRIAEMERDVSSVDDLQGQLESALIKLTNAENQIEDLKLQLDDALGAEDLLVQLTERNLLLSEKIEEMRISIEDLEALKELNDELEENHVESEKIMQEDLDRKDSQLREHAQKIELLEEACLDFESTIGQFRELVLQLQTELDFLRTQTQTAQHESATAASQTAAMRAVNLKLQTSASKNQTRTLEFELRKEEAKEAIERLAIIEPYLPHSYFESDSHGMNCYFFFQRLAHKIDLISTIVASQHGLPDALDGEGSESLVGVCEMKGNISALSTLCRRFAAIMRHCDVETFLNTGRFYLDLSPMEKRVDMHIDLLRREEFRIMEFVSDVDKMQSQFNHLAQSYFHGFDIDLAERELGYALSFENDLDMFAALIGLVRTALHEIIKDDDINIEPGDSDPDVHFMSPIQRLLDQCKGTKIHTKKLTKRIEELIVDSSALKSNLGSALQALSNLTPDLVNFGLSLYQRIRPHLSDLRTSKGSLQLQTVISFVQEAAAKTLTKESPIGVPWEAVSDHIARIAQEASSLASSILGSDGVVKIAGAAPWLRRIQEVKNASVVDEEAQRKLLQLSDEIQELARGIKTRDQTIQESTVKIELMERRMETVKKQADTINDLGIELSKARKQERAYEEAMEQLQSDLDALEQENAKLKTLAPQDRQAGAIQPTDAESIPIEGSLETTHLLEQIDALRGAVRFLRTENSFLKGQDLLREIEALPPIPEPAQRLSTPPLEPSTLSDSEHSDLDEPDNPPNLRSLATETKLLYRDVISFSSSPRIVDLSTLNERRIANGGRATNVWMPRKKTPAHQVWERKVQAEKLQRRVRGLQQRASTMDNSNGHL